MPHHQVAQASSCLGPRRLCPGSPLVSDRTAAGAPPSGLGVFGALGLEGSLAGRAFMLSREGGIQPRWNLGVGETLKDKMAMQGHACGLGVHNRPVPFISLKEVSLVT